MKSSISEFGKRVEMGGRLWAVLTVPEVVLLWGKTKKSVMMAIYTDRLRARLTLTGGSWLVEADSVVKLWGKPVNVDALRGE